jgi:ActR/RegA family two-component response regulator
LTLPAPIATALLISTDDAATRQVTDTLREFAMVAEVCVDCSTALHVLNRQHFEAVIVDMRMGVSARKVLERLRSSRSNQTAAAFAITDGSANETQVAFHAGSNFVLERPLCAESIGRSLTVAYGMIMRERRRYFRCPVVIPAVLRSHEGGELQCKSFNLSEGGMAVSGPAALRPGSQVIAEFKIPDKDTVFATEAKVCWSDGTGRVGLQFLGLPVERKLELQEWLRRRLEAMIPEDVSRKFQQPEEG